VCIEAWEQLKTLFHALGLGRTDPAGFLAKVCAGNDELHHEASGEANSIGFFVVPHGDYQTND